MQTLFLKANKRSTVIAILLMAVTLLFTACNKPEKKELAGAWRWTCTSGGIGGWYYTPESEGFEAEIVFKGSQFIFYKDGKKVASGPYRIDVEDHEDEMPNIGITYFYTLYLLEGECKKISTATNGIIQFTPICHTVLNDWAGIRDLTLSDHMADGYTYSFRKK